jgi:hypothetical protein
MNDDKLTAAARQLATEISPERDLWPEIESAIETPLPQRTRWTPMFAQAAAVVLLIGASSGLTYLAVKDDGLAVAPGYGTGLNVQTAAFGSRHALGSDYQAARAELAAKLDEELEHLSPEERADVEKSLEVLRGAIDEINAALEQDPDNALLQDILMNTYHEELNSPDAMRIASENRHEEGSFYCPGIIAGVAGERQGDKREPGRGSRRQCGDLQHSRIRHR